MIKTTRWSPDTCGCVFDYEWDTNATPEARIHSFKNVVKKCNVHNGLPLTQTNYDVALNENKTKNEVYRDFINNFPEFTEVEIDEDGNEMRRLKKGVKYEWSFTGTDANRELLIDFKGATLTQKQKDDLMALVAGKAKTVRLK